MVTRAHVRLRKNWELGAILMVLTGACNQIGGIEAATFRQCAEIQDCSVAVPACRVAIACENGRCVFQNAAHGAPYNRQIAGDCSEVICDGNGGTVSMPVLEDIPDDGNPCTIDACNEGMPSNMAAEEVPCFTGPIWNKNKGICKIGLQRCVNGELFGSCEGEVLPAEENCDWEDLDEDCDGQINEEGSSCACVPG